MSVDVVIPTYNGWELTGRCIAHLAEQSIPHSVIVVDNGSTDGTSERARETGARVVELGANLGFPVACNRGAAAGNGEIIVLLNNDVEARPDFLDGTLAAPQVSEGFTDGDGDLGIPDPEVIGDLVRHRRLARSSPLVDDVQDPRDQGGVVMGIADQMQLGTASVAGGVFRNQRSMRG